jgi:hypothetical protein
MGYDFALLLPEGAGDDNAAIERAIAVYEDEVFPADPDPRFTAVIDDLQAAGATDETDGWLSVADRTGKGGYRHPDDLQRR